MARRIRIITGLILFLFVTGHLINVALGLSSYELMDSWRGFFTVLWISPVGIVVLMGSLAIHGIFSLVSLYQRNTLNMSNTDKVQFVSGLLIVPLLAPHIIPIVIARELLPDYDPAYRNLLYFFWVENPLEGLRQILVLVFVWIHGAIGLLTYFRLQSWWPRYGRWINPLIVVIPVAALLGFVEAGKEVIEISPVYVPSDPGPVVSDVLNRISLVKWTAVIGFVSMLSITLVIRYVRLRGVVSQSRIQFANGPTIDTEVGATLLELSIAHDVPHANLCRGRGRCGTCRVKIISTENNLPPPEQLEQATLDRVGVGKDVRLACQFKPAEGNLTVERLVPPYIEPGDLTESVVDWEPELQDAADRPAEASS